MANISNVLSSFSLRKLLYNRKFTVPFSLLLAFVIWLVIVVKENPIIERSFANMTVNVNLENTIASENDENYSAYKKQADRAYKTLIRYSKGVRQEKSVKF